jgi:hypothetical protein
MGSTYGEEETSTEGERQGIPVGGRALDRVPGQQRDRDSQSCHLCQGQVNKDDAAGQDMETQVDVDTCKNQTGQERYPEKFNHKRLV